MKVLTDLGERPKAELLKSCNSQSIKEHFEKLNEKPIKKTAKRLMKIFSLIFYLAMCLFLDSSQRNMGLLIVCIATMIHILVKPTKSEQYLDNNRRTEFTSELFLNKTINRRNHKAYLLLHILVVLVGALSIWHTTIGSHATALIIVIVFFFSMAYLVHFLVQVYGIARNLTYDEMFYAHKWPHLWENVKHISERKFVIREFGNSEDKGVWRNVKDYFAY